MTCQPGGSWKDDTKTDNPRSTITRQGAMAVVLSEDLRRVLLLRREIFILWDLPGGGIEKDERAEEAVVRECREETGYDIEVKRLVGLYRHQSVYGRGDQLTHVYLSQIIGGVPRRFGLEITGLRWFAPSELPRGLQPLQRQMIMDTLLDSKIPFERWIKFPRWQLYPARVAFGIASLINRTLRLFL